MDTPGALNFPSSLRMPVRDFVRGIAGFANIGAQAVRNVPSILPQPVEERLRTAIMELEAAVAQILRADITTADILCASRFVIGDGADAPCLVRVMAYAWEQLRSSRRNTRDLFSETVAATHLALEGTAALGSGPARACRIVGLLRRSGAIGMPPGLPLHRKSAEQEEVDLCLFAMVLWLLAERPETIAAEDNLLELSAILTLVHRAEVIASMDDGQALAFQLASLSEQL